MDLRRHLRAEGRKGIGAHVLDGLHSQIFRGHDDVRVDIIAQEPDFSGEFFHGFSFLQARVSRTAGTGLCGDSDGPSLLDHPAFTAVSYRSCGLPMAPRTAEAVTVAAEPR